MNAVVGSTIGSSPADGSPRRASRMRPAWSSSASTLRAAASTPRASVMNARPAVTWAFHRAGSSWSATAASTSAPGSSATTRWLPTMPSAPTDVVTTGTPLARAWPILPFTPAPKRSGARNTRARPSTGSRSGSQPWTTTPSATPPDEATADSVHAGAHQVERGVREAAADGGPDRVQEVGDGIDVGRVLEVADEQEARAALERLVDEPVVVDVGDAHHRRVRRDGVEGDGLGVGHGDDDVGGAAQAPLELDEVLVVAVGAPLDRDPPPGAQVVEVDGVVGGHGARHEAPDHREVLDRDLGAGQHDQLGLGLQVAQEVLDVEARRRDLDAELLEAPDVLGVHGGVLGDEAHVAPGLGEEPEQVVHAHRAGVVVRGGDVVVDHHDGGARAVAPSPEGLPRRGLVGQGLAPAVGEDRLVPGLVAGHALDHGDVGDGADAGVLGDDGPGLVDDGGPERPDAEAQVGVAVVGRPVDRVEAADAIHRLRRTRRQAAEQ